MRYFLIIFLLFISACAPTPLVDAPPQIVPVYATSATEEWLPLVYECAAQTPGILVSRSPDIATADISIRLIAPGNSEVFIYQIGEIELVVGTNGANPVTVLSGPQLKDIFKGKIVNWSEVGGNDAEIALWVYEQGDDLQAVFSETLLEGSALSSMARQAESPEALQEEISADVNALGVLPHFQISENISALHSVGTFPVLMIVNTKPQGQLPLLLACLQGN